MVLWVSWFLSLVMALNVSIICSKLKSFAESCHIFIHKLFYDNDDIVILAVIGMQINLGGVVAGLTHYHDISIFMWNQ